MDGVKNAAPIPPRGSPLLWIALCASALALAVSCGGEAVPEKPNIILVIGDDHGWPYFGFMGDTVVKTPELDTLAREGTLFPYAFTTASQCRSSLATLLTGLHPVQWRFQIRALSERGTKRRKSSQIMDFATLPSLLAKRGYVSFQGGKYWEGTYHNAGFTHGMKNSEGEEMIRKWGWLWAQAGGDGLELGRTTMQPLWDFLEAHRGAPFFVWFAPALPHSPFDAAPRFMDLYEGAELSHQSQLYYANVSRFDELVGELVAYLDETGLRETTLLVYLSDNGWQQDPGATYRKEGFGGPKGKWSMYELGFRTPLIFSWPGRISRGQVRDELVSTVDVFSTLVDFAGGQLSPDLPGISLRPALVDGARFSREQVIGSAWRVRRPGRFSSADGPLLRPETAYFLRTREWRYIWFAESDRFPDRKPEELYRIRNDPYETRDVAAELPERAARYREEIRRWLEEMERPFL